MGDTRGEVFGSRVGPFIVFKDLVGVADRPLVIIL